ncbi:hypothetical protein GH714_030653 [Hevea brasiliensis]|uniref:Neprosin PEP catalytic domain-containing protein n=1 Tax=Hevea brasiliensis TaxID=3981 RepID=A0A6A6LVV6_HEVBR|nr:hypothetical protein GH714_030653 [Hevea brasiliensis]
MITLLGMIFYGFGVVEGKMITEKKISEFQRKINRLKSLAVISIQSEDGDIIDCIDIYKQPAFDHPALKNHTIQMAPSYDPKMDSATETTTRTNTLNKRNNEDSSVTVTSQLWQKSGSCPKGTIPIRRVQEKELLKTDSTEEYGRKKATFCLLLRRLTKEPQTSAQIALYTSLVSLLAFHGLYEPFMAILLTEGFSYSGVKGDIRAWNPFVESDDEYSTSQISLKSGPYYDFESLESGWAVNPSVYGDKQTRLFVYWTADASKTTGCFDLTCPGFVQTSSEVALGAAIYPLSVPYGLPYQITLYIFKDPATNNWWVQYGEKINLGYWPPNLFTLLFHGNAEGAEWGGEVYSLKLGHPNHTRTEMGNGQFPDGMFGNSGTVKRLRIRENSLILKFPEWVFTYSDDYDCYRTLYVEDYIEDPEFYYGGPGRSPVNSALYGDSDLTFQIPDCCFDLTCTGLVQTSSEIALSAAIEPISTFQSQYCINVRMFLDVTTGIGWLYGNNKPSGYWPGNLFSYLTYGAISVEWG